MTSEASGPTLWGRALRVQTADYHTGGEPFRIVTGGVSSLRGATVLDKRSDAIERMDDVRAFLCNEPRGHADMYGCFVCEPDDTDGDLGVVFFHKDGFSTACGHGTIAIVTWAIESEIIDRHGATTPVVVDAPSGRLHCVAATPEPGVVTSVRFRNVPAFVTGRDIELATDVGDVSVDVSFGGAFYASVAATDVGLRVEPTDLDRLIEAGRAVKRALVGHPSVDHPVDDRLSGLYGVIVFEPGVGEPGAGAALHQRNVTIFADGEVDRSPCGSGTSARLAVLVARGELVRGAKLCHDSLIGSRFAGRVIEAVQMHGRDAVVTEVEGRAHHTGWSTFALDPADRLGLGFQLR